MACEECLCTQHFQNRFHQCHGISAALSCTQSRVRWVIEVTGLAELPRAAASLRQQPGVTRDPQREKGSCQLGQTRNFKSLQDLQDLDALSHWADSKTDWYTSGNPHSSGGHNRNRWTQKLLFSIPGRQLQRLLKFWYLSNFGGLKLLSLSCLRPFEMVSQQTSP